MALAVVSLGLGMTVAQAAPPRAPSRTTAQPARPGETDARRREEADLAQRQDAAEALKKHFNIEMDWQTTPLERLLDVRVRAAKAAELQQRLGVTVDWQRYSWIELEALRRTLLSFERYRDEQAPTAGSSPRGRRQPPSHDDGLVPPTFKEQPATRLGRSTDPDGIIRPTFTGHATAPTVATDPDGVIRPTFAGRPRWSAFAGDPDGLIAPTFVPARRLSSLGDAADADGLIDPTKTKEGRPVPARW
jgi:hypothetical protein